MYILSAKNKADTILSETDALGEIDVALCVYEYLEDCSSLDVNLLNATSIKITKPAGVTVDTANYIIEKVITHAPMRIHKLINNSDSWTIEY